ncbi:FMN-linked oxidoreductase [Heliocybe sulcata]|uniref:FMN-linked oxidoreductase n=1 Tax=Heliocybe sulcata TaxID=5364 RepID=A0A5C3MVY2_9AGAM|nr:FMN-linked oxidoreductase [Heliocybe sulcata]
MTELGVIEYHGQPEHLKAFSETVLPCGRIIRNRFVKVAMYEHGAALLGGPPNAYHQALYRTWSTGHWGMCITGNVQVSPTHLTLGRDLVVPDVLTASTVRPFKELADSVRSGCSETLAILQLSHAGRQSPNLLGGRFPFAPPLAPSALRLGSGANSQASFVGRLLYHVLFQTPKEMTVVDIDYVVQQFTKGAEMAVEAGFDGIELHASHGYLLAQFISPKSNTRVDSYSAGKLALLHRLVSSIRETVPSDFVVGIKMNAADYAIAGGAMDADLPLQHFLEIGSWGLVDFIEISGGDYENPAFMGSIKPCSQRQALFSNFSSRAMNALSTLPPESQKTAPLVLLTGGLNTLSQCSSVLKNNYAHLLGIGRLSILCPDFPRRVSQLKACEGDYSSSEPTLDVPRPVAEFDEASGTLDRVWRHVSKLVGFPKLIGAGMEMAWYIVMMRRVAAGQEVDATVGGVGAVMNMWFWRAPSRLESRHAVIPIAALSVFLLVLAVVALLWRADS